MKLGKIAFKNISRNRKRSILSIVSTGISTFAIVFMFAYIEGMTNDMEDMAFNYETGQIIIRNREFDDKVFSLDRAVDNYIELLEVINSEIPGLTISPRLRFPSTILDGDRSHVCFGIAVDFDLERSYLDLDDKIISGDLPKRPREVLMGIGLAKELNLDLGDKFTPITMTRLGASSGITFQVSGLAKFSNGAFTNKTFIAPLSEVPKILRMGGAVSEIIVKNLEDREIDEVVSRLNRLFKSHGFEDIYGASWKSIGLSYAMIRLADISYTIMAFFFFILASSVIANTMLMVVFERKKEIGTLAAMGMDSSDVVRLFFLEALFLGLFGAAAGLVTGIFLVIPLSFIGIDMSSMAENVDMGTSFVIYPVLTLKSTLLVFCYSVFVASFVSFFPSKSVTKVDPVVALRSE